MKVGSGNQPTQEHAVTSGRSEAQNSPSHSCTSSRHAALEQEIAKLTVCFNNSQARWEAAEARHAALEAERDMWKAQAEAFNANATGLFQYAHDLQSRHAALVEALRDLRYARSPHAPSCVCQRCEQIAALLDQESQP